ncbi:putative glycogen debranching enzyme [Diplodia seriata]|uniref:Putative glycogen debranching enzyme n=1 Tax=Diplodia seriata TaxID=420778 RepID=A0A0G2EG60_9PEZI|nr:putative glycogen debranching enzyme [Diplodia seriata]
MISLLLLQPVLSEGDGGAIEAVIGAVLERVNRTDGRVCHEETIGDYATYLNLQRNITSTAPLYDYKMIDTDFYLPVVLAEYFVKRGTGRQRKDAFLATEATVDPANQGLHYGDLALMTAERIMNIDIAAEKAQELVQSYVNESNFGGSANSDNITASVRFHGIALDGNDNQSIVRVMNTDDCFRLFLVNSTNQKQLTSFLDQAAEHLLQPFPVGLSTSVGVLVANPAYGGDPVYARNFTSNAYHGTVVWSWQLSMLAAGLARQLDRCSSADIPDFCNDTTVHGKVRLAYNHLWDLIDANRAHLSSEVWSWVYNAEDFEYTPLGALPPPAGQSPTESNIRQLWSLTFLAVRRDEALR